MTAYILRTHSSHEPSPALVALPIAFERHAATHLGHVVGVLKFGRAIGDAKDTGNLVGPEPVKLDQEVLGAVGEAMVGGEIEGATVVFEDLCADRRLDIGWESKGAGDSLKETLDWQEGFESKGQRGIFRLQRGQRNLGLQLGLPDEGAPTELYDVAGT